MKRVAIVLSALFLSVFLAFTMSGAANATISGFGTTSDFRSWPYRDDCMGGNTWFLHQEYHFNGVTQFEARFHEDGVWQLQYNSEKHQWHVLGDPSDLRAPTYWANWVTDSHTHSFWETWYPATGGSCNVLLSI